MHFCPKHADMYNGDRFPAPTNGCMCDHAACTAGAALTVMVKADNNRKGTLAEFCSEFGYDTDSKRAEKIYYACKKQWQNVQRLWTDEEIDRLADIQ